jgi:hypothetical protein
MMMAYTGATAIVKAIQSGFLHNRGLIRACFTRGRVQA